MNMSDIIRKFEKFVFDGVPETPEPSFDRDDFSHYTQRSTGQSVTPSAMEFSAANSTLIGYVQIDIATETERFVRTGSEE